MGLTVATLETLFTANIKDFTTKTDVVEKTQDKLAKSDPVVKVTADNTGALADMDKVQAEGKKITSTEVVAQVDADIVKATAATDRIKADLAILQSQKTTPEVTADIAKAQAALSRAESDLKTLNGARATMVVEVDADKAKASGDKAGKEAGEGMSAGILAAIIALPVAGAIVGVGVAIGKALMDGLQVEVRSDRLMAQTGLDAESIAPIARAAGEAYANNWGESIASNMDTARAAIQSGLLDVDGTAKDSQAVIESLSGVADIIGEEIPAVARATAQLLRTGLAKDAAGAFDLLVKGSQAGLNVSEDLIDTVTEYSTQFRKLGLDGPMAFGLMSQAVKGGIRDTDTAADALKEFAIRAVDGSKTTTDGFKAIGLSATDMAAKIAAGGPTAQAALGLTLDKIRAIKDPTAQAAAGVALFGTKWEDAGAAMLKMDTKTAVAELGKVEGAAKSAMDTLGDNTAGKLESARRNIQVAADGIKGALATAFAPQIEGFATFVTENRAAVMTFLLDLSNGAIDAGRALVNATAAGIEGFGNLVGTAGPAMFGFLDQVVTAIASTMAALDPTGVLGLKGAAESAVESYNKMQVGALAGFAATKEGSADAAQALRDNLIANGLDPTQAKLNSMAIPMVAQAALHDASVAMAKSVDAIGFSGDGTKLSLDALGVSSTGVATKGGILDTQIKTMVASLDAEAVAAAAAGEDQGALNLRYGEGRTALINQLVAMGLTGAQAKALADKYRAIPGKAETKAVLDKAAADAALSAWNRRVTTMPDGSIVIGVLGYAQSYQYLQNLQSKMRDINNTPVRIATGPGGSGGITFADGGTYQAANGLDRQSMIAPGGSNILWAEAETGWETYISGKPSQRARNIGLLGETARRFGLTVMPAGTTRAASGLQVSAQSTAASQQQQTPDIYVQNPFTGQYLLAKVAGVVDSRTQGLVDSMVYGGA